MSDEISLATVAARAGVSVSTVSRIVNGETKRASAATIQRVQAAIEAVGYRPNPVGRALRRRESRVVAMLIANLDNPAMATIASSTEAALRSAGYVMILCDTHDRADLQDEYLEAMRAQFVRGFVLVAAVPSPGLADLSAQGAPLVFVTRRPPHGAGAFVGIDNRGAGAAVAARFLAEGCKAPAVVFPRLPSSAARERVEGFLAQLEAQGTRLADIRLEAGEGLSHLHIGYDGAERLFSTGPMPDAVLCVSDQIAYGVHRRALERNIRIPADCVLISIDGTPLNRWVAPWLRSLEIPYADYGQHVVESFERIWSGAPDDDRILPFCFPA